MNIALVDDDAEALRLLSSLFEAQLTQMFDAIHRIDTYPSGEAFLHAWTAGAYDLIVLDIYMERRNGIAVAEQIRQTDQSVQIAFCTSSNEFAAETYAVNARDYLQKPITAEKVTRLLHKLDAAQIEQSRSVLLPDGAALRCRSVIYAEYSNHRMRFHMKTGKHHTVYASFAEIQKLLMPFGFFFSPMKGVLLNFYEVARLSGDSFLMKDGTTLPIARRICKDAQAQYSEFQFRTLSREVDL